MHKVGVVGIRGVLPGLCAACWVDRTACHSSGVDSVALQAK